MTKAEFGMYVIVAICTIIGILDIYYKGWAEYRRETKERNAKLLGAAFQVGKFAWGRYHR